MVVRWKRLQLYVYVCMYVYIYIYIYTPPFLKRPTQGAIVFRDTAFLFPTVRRFSSLHFILGMDVSIKVATECMLTIYTCLYSSVGTVNR